MIIMLEGCLGLLRFFMGASIFSFLNVVICRLPRGESVVGGRSRCMTCGRTLSPKELIPLISFLVQRGKCRGCKSPVSKRYFVTECLGGLSFVLCGIRFGVGPFGLLSAQGLAAYAFLGILTVIAFIDRDTKMIYDRFQLMILGLGIWALWLWPEHGLTDRIIGALVTALPMFLLALAVEGAFGGGDIKLMAVSGFLLGWRSILAAMLIALTAGGSYCAYMLCRRRMSRKDSFAFGPFLAAGLAAALFFGDAVAEWYLSLL